MESMFSGALSFNQPIGTWNLSSVKDMGNIFYNWLARDSSLYSFSHDLCGWGETLSPDVEIGALAGSACPVQDAPNLTATPPGPFCVPCNERSYPIVRICPSESPTMAPSMSPNTTQPTLVPSNFPTTGVSEVPSSQPTDMRTTSPPLSSLNFSFPDLSLFLQGFGELDATTRTIFEKETESFYLSLFAATRRRLSVGDDVVLQATEVAAESGVLTTNGYTIAYSQTLLLSSTSGGDIDEELAREVLTEPFTKADQVQSYLSQLTNASDAFATITSVSGPIFLNEGSISDDDDGPRIGLIVGLALAGLCGCACCSVVACWVYRRKDNHYARSGASQGPLGKDEEDPSYPEDEPSWR